MRKYNQRFDNPARHKTSLCSTTIEYIEPEVGDVLKTPCGCLIRYKGTAEKGRRYLKLSECGCLQSFSIVRYNKDKEFQYVWTN